MTDFRELCVELVNELHGYKVAHPNHDTDLIDRARAALAEPEPEGPTDDEVDDLCAEHSLCYEDSDRLDCLVLSSLMLARWGK